MLHPSLLLNEIANECLAPFIDRYLIWQFGKKYLQLPILIPQIFFSRTPLHASWQKDHKDNMALLKFKRTRFPLIYISSFSPTATGAPMQPLLFLTHSQRAEVGS